jgi:Uncharacterized alpha/beta hydrolase domain (DUF2235)
MSHDQTATPSTLPNSAAAHDTASPRPQGTEALQWRVRQMNGNPEQFRLFISGMPTAQHDECIAIAQRLFGAAWVRGALNESHSVNPDQRGAMYEMQNGGNGHRGVGRETAISEAATSRRLNDTDRQEIRRAQAQIATMKPRRIDNPNNPNLVQIEVAFDGTGNSAGVDEWDSNPAQLNHAFAGEHSTYVRGVMTQGEGAGNQALEGGFGAGIRRRLDVAYNHLVDAINAAKATNPNAEVVLVVTGFSRGAETARLFVNEVNARGIPVHDGHSAGEQQRFFEAPRIGVMVLFDTVAMRQEPNRYGDAIPANAENVLHLTARDERRALFPLTEAEGRTNPLTRQVHVQHHNPAITQIALPGAHSDVGGGYANHYSDVAGQLAFDYMVNAGVKMNGRERPVVDLNDPSYRLHESRSAPEAALGNREPRRHIAPAEIVLQPGDRDPNHIRDRR